MLTIAEILFERWCRERQVRLWRIPTCEVQTPDYEMGLSTGPVLVEVKQLEPNAEDLEMIETLKRGESAGRWVNAARARGPITKAVKEQLSPHTQGRKPAIVVLYDTVGLVSCLDPHSIAVCLYGLEQVHYDVPDSPMESVRYRGMSRGGNRGATETQNTTLSAVAVLTTHGPNRAPSVDLFHNKHAAIKLDPISCDAAGFRQFNFIRLTSNAMPDWAQWNSDARTSLDE